MSRIIAPHWTPGPAIAAPRERGRRSIRVIVSGRRGSIRIVIGTTHGRIFARRSTTAVGIVIVTARRTLTVMRTRAVATRRRPAAIIVHGRRIRGSTTVWRARAVRITSVCRALLLSLVKTSDIKTQWQLNRTHVRDASDPGVLELAAIQLFDCGLQIAGILEFNESDD